MRYFEWQWWLDFVRDRERFRYELLGDLRKIQDRFRQLKLSPAWKCLRYNWTAFLHWDYTFRGFNNKLPKELVGIDLNSFNLRLSEIHSDPRFLEFSSLGREILRPIYQEGQEVKEHLIRQFHLEVIGVEPLYKNEGYLLLQNGAASELSAFRYKYNGINDRRDRQYMPVTYQGRYLLSVENTINRVKKTLLSKELYSGVLPVYLIQSEVELPLWETVRPLAKRKLVEYLAEVD